MTFLGSPKELPMAFKEVCLFLQLMDAPSGGLSEGFSDTRLNSL